MPPIPLMRYIIKKALMLISGNKLSCLKMRARRYFITDAPRSKNFVVRVAP